MKSINSGNIFQDLGFPNAEKKLTKIQLASVIPDILATRKMLDLIF